MEGLTWASCVAVISGSLVHAIASLATETTGGEILVAFWLKHGLRSDLRVPNFPGGACPPDLPSLFTLKPMHAVAVPVYNSWLRP